MQVMSEEKEEKKKGDVRRKNEKLPCLTLSFPPQIPHRHIQFCSLHQNSKLFVFVLFCFCLFVCF